MYLRLFRLGNSNVIQQRHQLHFTLFQLFSEVRLVHPKFAQLTADYSKVSSSLVDFFGLRLHLGIQRGVDHRLVFHVYRATVRLHSCRRWRRLDGRLSWI